MASREPQTDVFEIVITLRVPIDINKPETLTAAMEQSNKIAADLMKLGDVRRRSQLKKVRARDMQQTASAPAQNAAE